MPHLPWCCGGTKCCCQKYSSSSWLFALPLDTQEDDDAAGLPPPQFHLQFLFFIASRGLARFSFPDPTLLSSVISVWSGLCQDRCYFDLLFVVIFSYFACSFLQLAVACCLREQLMWRRSWRRRQKTVLLKLESVCQGTSIYPSGSGIHPFAHQPIFYPARRKVQCPQDAEAKISILQLLCSGEDRVRGRPDHNRI